MDTETMALREVRDDLAFLGREFLTWLVFHADCQGGDFDDAETPFTISVGHKLTLRAPGGNVSDMIVKGASVSTSADLRYALAGGLAVKEAQFTIEAAEMQFHFTLSSGAGFKAVKLPSLGDDKDGPAMDPVGERIAMLERLDAHVRHGFKTFMGARTSSQWATATVPAMRRWIVEGVQAGDGAAG